MKTQIVFIACSEHSFYMSLWEASLFTGWGGRGHNYCHSPQMDSILVINDFFDKIKRKSFLVIFLFLLFRYISISLELHILTLKNVYIYIAF